MLGGFSMPASRPRSTYGAPLSPAARRVLKEIAYYADHTGHVGVSPPATTHEITLSQWRNGFAPIYRTLSRCGKEFSANECIVLLNLLEHLGQSVDAHPTQAIIAEETGMSVATVKLALNKLKAAGFLIVRQQPSVAGRRDIYDLDLAAILAWAGPYDDDEGFDDDF